MAHVLEASIPSQKKRLPVLLIGLSMHAKQFAWWFLADHADNTPRNLTPPIDAPFLRSRAKPYTSHDDSMKDH